MIIRTHELNKLRLKAHKAKQAGNVQLYNVIKKMMHKFCKVNKR